ncbi:DUF2180 family protein [Streptomyces sp. SID13666]|uniref:DUF2180 family protein n=1 Tax=unclassified Streptomyces TaxID=2593676 RepID=UPI0013C079F4|nr:MULTISPECIES: DUF2180 family protein [unclassified Streptomyces]NEA59657.1 DUF2180 family protein [Streptomyces sp. SID13666]NEA75820.1 DUF2180 family protein [Streptomyces sp. SID13588]
MNCYDCNKLTDRVTPAVAVCPTCGAGVCGEHANTVPNQLHRPMGMGLATLPRATRRILCTTCISAERSA